MSADFATQRAVMVEGQVRVADVTDYALQDAMRVVPREALLPPQKAHLAYADIEPPYAPGRWLLRPRDVARLLQALKPRAGERALAIAAPYAAAIMTAMGVEVTRLDTPELEPADGDYDIVVCEGAVAETPASWTAALKADGGRLGVIERRGPVGRAELWLRTPRGLGRRDLFDCAAPIMSGFEPKPRFVF
jgi:protein-L-isoaspartate(D-aspartate) O-methyltransferase